nr:probable leucine-rich repeat receptor-like protein kinase At1g35710 [Ziziphus jujuba var. spinosa]
MNFWNHSIHFCNWVGITCNTSSQQVMVLNLKSLQLAGSIPPSIGNLTYLTGINLMNNSFHGEIPQEMGHLLQLQLLNYRTIPSALHGNLPPDVGCTLPNLKVFAGAVNKLTGPIPISLSNCSALEMLDFSQNYLTGSVLETLGSLQKVCRIILRSIGWDMEKDNSINGNIPKGIENLVNLTLLGLEHNQLRGSVPEAIGKFHKLQELYLRGNKFSGSILFSLGNLTSLTVLFLEENGFEGSKPQSLGN